MVRGRGQSGSPTRAGRRENGGESLKFKPAPPKSAFSAQNRWVFDPKRGFLHPKLARGAPSFVFEGETPQMWGFGVKMGLEGEERAWPEGKMR